MLRVARAVNDRAVALPWPVRIGLAPPLFTRDPHGAVPDGRGRFPGTHPAPHAVVASGFTPRSPSSRIRPTAPSSSSSSRAAASASCANGVVLAADFLDLRRVDRVSGGERGCSAWRSRPTTRRAAASSSTSPTRPGDTVVARFQPIGDDPLVADPASRFDLRVGRAAQRVHRAAVRESQRRPPGVRPRRLPLHRPGRRRLGQRSGATARRIPATLLGKMLRIDVNVPDGDPHGLSRAAGQSVRRRQPVARARDLGVRPAQSVALLLRRSGARRHRRARDRRRRPERAGRKSTTSRPAAAAATTAGATAKARTTTSRRSPPAFLPLIDPIFEYDHTRRAVDHRRLRLSRHARSAPPTAAATSSPTSSAAASGRSR